jgi:hypothetical protein
MGKIYSSTMFLLLSVYVQANIRTVSNNPATLAQFSTIQAAVDASSIGDTIYVHGSPNLYASFTVINKQLTIIGPGWSPNKDLPLTAVIAGCTITGAGSSNTEIQGMIFTNSIHMSTNHPDNIRFIRNQFSITTLIIDESSVTYIGYLFEGNVIDNSRINGASTSTYQNFLFQNNYIYNNAGSPFVGNIFGFTNSVNVLFNHNLWFGPGSGVQDCFASNCRFLTLTNNIFVRRDAANNNSFSTFNNNITWLAPPPDPWTLNSNVNSGGNLSNQDPHMAAEVFVDNGVDSPLLSFTIAGPSSTNNAGSDGKDMGLLFDATGSLNWTTSRTSRLPFIFSMNITNPTIAAGGTLNVQVEARKNN